jgi:hypothetical protein
MRGQGVGDHVKSWAFDGLRKKKWNVTSEVYGRRWRVGDVVGSLLDVGRRQMRFFINGEDMGLAFKDMDFEDVGAEGGDSGLQMENHRGGLRPAASLNTGQKAFFNFGQSKFKYPPDPAAFLKADSDGGGPNGNDVVRGVGEGILYVTGGGQAVKEGEGGNAGADGSGGNDGAASNSSQMSAGAGAGSGARGSSSGSNDGSVYVPTSNLIYDPFHAWRRRQEQDEPSERVVPHGIVDQRSPRESSQPRCGTAVDLGGFVVDGDDAAGGNVDDVFFSDRSMGVALDLASSGFGFGNNHHHHHGHHHSHHHNHHSHHFAGAVESIEQIGNENSNANSNAVEMAESNNNEAGIEVEDRNESSTPRNAAGMGEGGEGVVGAAQQHGMQTEEDIDEIEAQRQILIENLIGMGFPIEWAIRASESMRPMNESLAIAWIIERMELEDGDGKIDGEEDEEGDDGEGEGGGDGEGGGGDGEGEGGDNGIDGEADVDDGGGSDEDEDGDDVEGEDGAVGEGLIRIVDGADGEAGADAGNDDYDDVSGYLQRLGFRDMTYDEEHDVDIYGRLEAQENDGVAVISHESLSSAYGSAGVAVGAGSSEVRGEVVRRTGAAEAGAAFHTSGTAGSSIFLNESMFDEHLFPPSHLATREVAVATGDETNNAKSSSSTSNSKNNSNKADAAFPASSDAQVNVLLELVRESNPDEISELALIVDTVMSILFARSVVTSILGHSLAVVAGVGSNSSPPNILNAAGWRVGMSRAPGICGSLASSPALNKLPATLLATQPFGVLGIENHGWEEEDQGVSQRSVSAVDLCGLSLNHAPGGVEEALCKDVCRSIGSSSEVRKRFIDFMKLSLFREASDYQVGWSSGKHYFMNSVDASNCFSSTHNNNIRDIFDFVSNDFVDEREDEGDEKKDEGDGGINCIETGFRMLRWEDEQRGKTVVAWDDLFQSLDDDGKKQKLCRLQEMGGLMALFARHALAEEEGDTSMSTSFVELLKSVIDEGIVGFEQILGDPSLDTEMWTACGAKSKAAGAMSNRKPGW